VTQPQITAAVTNGFLSISAEYNRADRRLLIATALRSRSQSLEINAASEWKYQLFPHINTCKYCEIHQGA